MRANISEELMDAIEERIYCDLEIHILTKKMNKAQQENNKGFATHIDGIIQQVIKQRVEVNTYLKQNGVKVFEAEEVDDMFVQYKYYQRVNGGIKEGFQRYWKAALKLKLKRRMSKYFLGGD